MAWNEFGPILDDRAVLELKSAQSIGTVDPNELGTKLVSDYCQGRYGLPDDLKTPVGFQSGSVHRSCFVYRVVP
jgi:hypothetical protein